MTFYITTPIYYVNDTPHIGHAYTTVVADVLARYHRLFGDETYFLTGTDEHGQKVQTAAKNRGLSPQQHVDDLVVRFQDIWKELGISNDIFMRTTFDYHKRVVTECLQVLWEKGEIYASDYEGWYSVSEEIFYTEKDLVNGKSPAGKEVQKIVEKNYFFRMSKYQERLIEYIERNPDFIQPAGKRSEVLGFLRQPLGDLCISRPMSRLSWGIPLPFDGEYVTYVWFDALINYASAIGYRQGAKEENFKKWWPSVTHLLGKDILTTHAVYWTTMLMALELPLPKQIFAHGWWLTDNGGKMSKSEGPVVAPLDVKNIVGTDALRYFLVRDIRLGNDAQFSLDLVKSRVNAELANNLGNLLSRVTNLAHKFFEGRVPARGNAFPETAALEQRAAGIVERVKKHIIEMSPDLAVGEVVELLSATNKYLDTAAPWKRAKENLAEAGESIYTALEALRIAGILLNPVMPTKSKLLLRQLSWLKEPSCADIGAWGGLQPGTELTKGEALFPRIE